MEYEYSRGGARRGIQIYNWSVSILWSYGTHKNDYLYKTALGRRLLRFNQPGDVVYAQTMESFFIRRFLNLQGATGFAKRNWTRWHCRQHEDVSGITVSREW